jgi:hypothetical protein
MNTEDMPRKPKQELTFRFCPECGHDDRFTLLNLKHYANGRRCHGVPVVLKYSLVSVSEDSQDGRNNK